MCQPRKWWWGLIPLALMWVIANWQNAGPIAADLKAKAEKAGLAVAAAVPGLQPLVATVAGRDVRLSGDVTAANLQGEAARAVDAERGVRLVDGTLRVASPQRPYTFAAERAGNRITLTGFVPDDATKAANVAAAGRAFNGAEVVDQQRVAFGAPAGFAAALAGALPEMGKLSAGKVSVTDQNFCVEGAATTPETFGELTTRFASAPQGFSRQACAITPPTVTPYVWSAAKAATGAITLTGLYPSGAVRAEINAAARSAAPGAPIVDQMRPALGAPAGFAAMATAGLGQLTRLVEGAASISGTAFSLTGRGPASFEACEAVRRASGAAPQGFTGTSAIECPPPPPPPPPVALNFVATKSASGIVLTGLAPSEAAKAAAGVAARAATSGTVTNNLTVTPNIATSPDFASATGFALGQLTALETGVASLAGASLSVTGAAPSVAVKGAVDTAVRAALPAGLTLGRAEVTAPAPPPPPPPPPPAPVVVAPPPAPVVTPPVAPPAAPVPAPLAWMAIKDSNGVTLSGLAPSAEARAVAAIAARAATPGAVIDNQTVQAPLATPPAHGLATDFALTQLGRLSIGVAEFAGPQLSLRGVAATPAARAAVESAFAGALPGGVTRGAVDIAVRPYVFSAQSSRSGVTLSGYAPDQASIAEAVKTAEDAGFAGRVTNDLVVVGGAPANMAGAIRTGLGGLLRLDMGTLRIEDQTATLQGLTCREVLRQEVETTARIGLPAGFAGSGQVALRQTGCLNCQIELDVATAQRPILFEQARSEVGGDAGTRGVLDDVARILNACPNERVLVEGHTNSDGARERNMPLSEARARAVIQALVARGLSGDRFTPAGFGPDRPLIPHGSEEAREKNRRVQFTIVNR